MLLAVAKCSGEQCPLLSQTMTSWHSSAQTVSCCVTCGTVVGWSNEVLAHVDNGVRTLRPKDLDVDEYVKRDKRIANAQS